jgi:sugar/nucleoside kinase (ribokinase family)
MKKYDVIAIGELNVDLILSGLKSMPSVGQEIIAENSSVVLGSSTAITASGLAKLGMTTGFIGKLGKDNFAEVVMESLKTNQIDTSHVIIDDSITTGLTISLSTSKDRALVTHLGSIEALALEDIELSLLDHTRHIHIGSYFLQHSLRAGIPKLFKEANKRGVTTSLDVGWDDTNNWNYGIWDALAYTDIFFPNETEALHITGKENVQAALDELSKHANRVIVKCGSMGAVGKYEGVTLQQKAFDVNPIDTTGAGDSFNAGFIYGFLHDFSFEKCLLYGNACGSVSVTRIGGATSCAALSDVERMIGNH